MLTVLLDMFVYHVSVHLTGNNVYIYRQAQKASYCLSSNPEIYESSFCGEMGEWSAFPQVTAMVSWQMEAAAVPR